MEYALSERNVSREDVKEGICVFLKERVKKQEKKIYKRKEQRNEKERHSIRGLLSRFRQGDFPKKNANASAEISLRIKFREKIKKSPNFSFFTNIDYPAMET